MTAVIGFSPHSEFRTIDPAAGPLAKSEAFLISLIRSGKTWAVATAPERETRDEVAIEDAGAGEGSL